MRKKLLERLTAIVMAFLLIVQPITAFAEDAIVIGTTLGEENVDTFTETPDGGEDFFNQIESNDIKTDPEEEIVNEEESDKENITNTPIEEEPDISEEEEITDTEQISDKTESDDIDLEEIVIDDESDTEIISDESTEEVSKEQEEITDNEKKEDENSESIKNEDDGVIEKAEELRVDGENAIQTFLAAGNSISDATSISIGNTYNGSITSGNTVDFYKFTISSAGRVSLTATAGMRWINYYIYDSAGNSLWSKNPSWNSVTELINTSEFIDLTKGTYYFAVKKDSYTGNYSFRLDFSSAHESFTETGVGNNNTINTASSIRLNTSYNGQIAANDDKDFYKFDLPSSGRIVISSTARMKWINYYIYDSSGKQLWERNPSWNSTTETITTSEIVDLTKGTYYFVASRDGAITGNYSFKLNYINANESFTEVGEGTDNGISSANSISLNTNYNGQIAINDEKDFYKFTLNSATRITFTATVNIKWIYYYIYDSSGNEVWRKNSYWNEVTGKIDTSESMDLSAGTYYLAFNREGSNTGSYMFKIATHTHSYKNVITKATTSSNGKIVKTCSCGATNGITTIYYAKSISLSPSKYTYNGKVRTPSVIVKGSDGKTIGSSNYTVSYSSGRKNVGKYSIKVKLKGRYYEGTLSNKFTINPKATSITKLIAKSKSFTVKWKKQTTQVTGYQIQYSTSKSFSSKTTKTITKNSATSATYKRLKGKKKYYVRIRTYKTVSGAKYFSSWSSAKTIKTKK